MAKTGHTKNINYLFPVYNKIQPFLLNISALIFNIGQNPITSSLSFSFLPQLYSFKIHKNRKHNNNRRSIHNFCLLFYSFFYTTFHVFITYYLTYHYYLTNLIPERNNFSLAILYIILLSYTFGDIPLTFIQ